MRQPTQRGLQVLRRAHEFLTKNEVTAALGPVTNQVTALGQCMERLAKHAVDQDEHERGFRASARVAQERAKALKDEFIRPTARIAQSLFPDDAELRQSLAMPNVKGYEKTLAAALAMAGRAAEHKERFVAAGFAEDFLDRMRAAAATLRAAIDDKGAHYGKRSAATAGMLDELSRGRDLVRVLDDLVRPVLRKSPDRIAEWKTVSRFARLTRAEEAAPEPPGTPGTPPPVVPPVVPPATTAVPVVVTPSTPVAAEGGALDRAA